MLIVVTVVAVVVVVVVVETVVVVVEVTVVLVLVEVAVMVVLVLVTVVVDKVVVDMVVVMVVVVAVVAVMVVLVEVGAGKMPARRTSISSRVPAVDLLLAARTARTLSSFNPSFKFVFPMAAALIRAISNPAV
jgi:hypothetical protein